MPRTRLFADPDGIFLHDAILAACSANRDRIAIVDSSALDVHGRGLQITYGEYGDLIQRAARGMVAAGVKPGEVIAIFLANGWEFAVAYHAATLAGAIPTLLNPNYREREARYQLECSGAVMLITDAAQIAGLNISGLDLRGMYTTRRATSGTCMFADFLEATPARLPSPELNPGETLAALPFSSGTTGLPKGVMLTHENLLTNAYQFLAPGEEATLRPNEVALCFLPLYHIYGLNVMLNPLLLRGGTAILMPRFGTEHALQLISDQSVTWIPMVPPVMNALCQAAEKNLFPRHSVRFAKCGAAPLSPELPRRFTALTGIRVRQGYGMTEASPVTHMGYVEPDLYQPDSIGPPVALTECLLVDAEGNEVSQGEPGELVMRGPQVMKGYWKSPEATAEVLRDGWYWSGDVARRDQRDFYFIVDRRKEMIKYKGFPISPAEVEAVLMEHPAVRDCGVIARPDAAAGEVPVAYIVLKEGHTDSQKMKLELAGHVAETLISYKQPREVRFVEAIPRTPSGKILRRELRALT